jgi:acyl-CoA synthetase (NDP forming)
MLEALFKPRSIAVIGASDRSGSLGKELALNVISSFKGPVHLVNIRGGVILGRSAYRRVSDVPEAVDLALIITPSDSVPEVLEDCGKVGVRGAIVYSGGFSEMGRGDLEEEVVRIARRYSIRLLGPNSVGVIDTETPLNATFVSTERQLIPSRGGVSLISQSGALGSLILDLMGERLVNLRRFASIGNASDIKMWELVGLLAGDAKTEVIGVYLESVKEGRRLLEALRSASMVKPVVVLAGGLSETGSKAALTHVAALTIKAKVLEGALRQSRVISVGSLGEFVAVLEVLSRVKVKPKGGRVLVVTNTGGMGVLLSDSMERRGLRLASLPEELVTKLRSLVPGYMALSNPIDLSGAAPTSLYISVIRELLNSKAADILVVVNQPQTAAMDVDNFLEYAKSLKGSEIPVVILVSGSGYSRSMALKLRQTGLPVASDPEEASSMVLALLRQPSPNGGGSEVKVAEEAKALARRLIGKALGEGRTVMGEHEAKYILKAYDIETPRYELALECGEATSIAEKLGYPVVLKLISPQLTHRSDIGGVITGLRGPEEVASKCSKLLEISRRAGITLTGILVEEHVEHVAEIAVGALKDKLLGPIVMVGLGGYMIELLEDTAFRLAPLTLEEAIEMIKETRVQKLVESYRGIKVEPVKLAETIARIGRIVEQLEEIEEIDINPLAVTKEGKLVALDAKIKIKPL